MKTLIQEEAFDVLRGAMIASVSTSGLNHDALNAILFHPLVKESPILLKLIMSIGAWDTERQKLIKGYLGTSSEFRLAFEPFSRWSKALKSFLPDAPEGVAERLPNLLAKAAPH
jgi:hypothetical protein